MRDCARSASLSKADSPPRDARTYFYNPQLHHAILIARQRRQSDEARAFFRHAGERRVAAHDEIAGEGDLRHAGRQPDLDCWIEQRTSAAIRHANSELIAMRK